DDEPAVGLHAPAIEVEPVGGRAASDGDEYLLDVDRLRLLARVHGQAHTRVRFVDVGDLRGGVNGDAAALERRGQLLGQVGVLEGNDPVEGLDERHLGTERPVDGRELDTDGAGADDRDRRGKRLECERVVGGDDAFTVRVEAG